MQAQAIPPREWHAFLRAELPSPREFGNSANLAEETALSATSNARRRAREEAGAPPAAVQQIDQWWSPHAAPEHAAERAARRPLALSVSTGRDPGLGLAGSPPPERHMRRRQPASSDVQGADLRLSPSRAFLAPVGAPLASAEARSFPVHQAVAGAVEAAAAAAEQARQAVVGQKASQTAAEMASIASAMIVGYASSGRREPLPLHPAKLARPAARVVACQPAQDGGAGGEGERWPRPAARKTLSTIESAESDAISLEIAAIEDELRQLPRPARRLVAAGGGERVV